MTATLNKFAARLAELQGSSLDFRYVEGPPPAIIIPARHVAVGEITIYDDGDELTIDIGRKHHTHVSCYNFDRYPESDRLDMVVQDAAEFVNDVMCDRVCITVDFIGDRCVGSSHYYIEEEEKDDRGYGVLRGIDIGKSPGGRRSERFLWSGPIKPAGRTK